MRGVGFHGVGFGRLRSRRGVGGGPALSPVDRYLALNGGAAPAYVQPEGAYISEQRSKIVDTTLITAQTNPSGLLAIGGGKIDFPAHANTHAARIRLEDGPAIPAGSALRIQWEKIDGSGTGSVRLSFVSSQNVGASAIALDGWHCLDLVTTAEIPASPSTNRYVQVSVTGATGAAQVRNVSVWPKPTPAKRRGFLAAGQSGMQCNEAGDVRSALDIPHPRMEYVPNTSSGSYLPQNGVIMGATAPLQMSSVTLGLSPAWSFLRSFADRRLAAGENTCLLANAEGGTSLLQAGGAWNPNSTATQPTQYTQAITDAQAFLAADPDNVLEAVLWCQGEADRGVNGAANYPPAFASFVAAVRSALGLPSLPFVVFGLNPYATDNAYHADMIAAQATMDQDSGHANAIPGVIYLPYDPAWGDLSVAPGDVHIRGDGNRLRGLAGELACHARGLW